MLHVNSKMAQQPCPLPRQRKATLTLFHIFLLTISICLTLLTVTNVWHDLNTRGTRADSSAHQMHSLIPVVPFLSNQHKHNQLKSMEPVTTFHWKWPSELPPLPQWIHDYIQWHRSVRAKYPGKSLIEDPSAPPILVRNCLVVCGGLHDRLGQLPMDLYLANQTKRILLFKWGPLKEPAAYPLEEYLLPPSWGLDWTFPPNVTGWDSYKDLLHKPSLNGDRKKTLDQLLEERHTPINRGRFERY